MSSPGADPLLARACRERLTAMEPLECTGRVEACVGTVIEASGLRAAVGAVCTLAGDTGDPIRAEVIGFRGGRSLLMSLEPERELRPGLKVRVESFEASVVAGSALLGRVLDGLGRPLDGGPPVRAERRVPLYRRSPRPLERTPIREPLDLGVRALNGMVTAGRGMRLGIFAGSGIGKSTLLGQIARHCGAEVRVIALIGERGREVREFVERELGDALAHSVVIVATGDEAPLMRVRAAHAATAIAESFRDQGRDVLLLMDSLTRFCLAAREIGLASGEPPTTRGFTPSVWSGLPRLVERAGTRSAGGSITGIYTVLVEGDDPTEPVADHARSLLDGHVALSRELAEAGHFPPIDVLGSVSRVMRGVIGEVHLELAQRARAALAAYRGAEDLISVGAYAPGSDPAVDAARQVMPQLRAFLRQTPEEGSSLVDTVASLEAALAPPSAAAAADAGATR